MKELKIHFTERDFSAPRTYTGRPALNSMEWHRLGGPKAASITMYAGPQDLFDLVNLLRCGVEVRDESGQACWWGYVHELQMRLGAIEIGATLSSMYNRVAVAYSYVEPGSQLVGARKTTAWVDQAQSQAEYGVKELLHMGSGMSDGAAETLRDVMLTQRAWPQGSGSQGWGLPQGRARYSGAENSLSATLLCRGWYETLGWDYPTVGMPEAAYRGEVADWTSVYADAGSQMHAQSFTVGSAAINAISVTGKYMRVGSPADNLVVAIQADSAGAPSGVNLASGTIAASTLETILTAATVTFGAAMTLAAGTTYWVVWSRSGAVDGTNYARVGIKASTGYAGEFKTYNGSVWGGASIYTAYFSVLNGDVETTTQIASLATSAVSGQFLSGTQIEAASTVFTRNYLDGTQDGLTAIETLLKLGGANDQRLGAVVTPERRLWVKEDPGPESIEYQMDRWGRLFAYPGGDAVDERRPPVGCWLRLADLGGANINLGMINDPTLQFIEGATWDSSGGTRYTFRGQPGLDALLGVEK